MDTSRELEILKKRNSELLETLCKREKAHKKREKEVECIKRIYEDNVLLRKRFLDEVEQNNNKNHSDMNKLNELNSKLLKEVSFEKSKYKTIEKEIKILRKELSDKNSRISSLEAGINLAMNKVKELSDKKVDKDKDDKLNEIITKLSLLEEKLN